MLSAKRFAVLMATCLMVFTSGHAEFPFEITGSPVLEFNTGHTEYEISGADPVLLDNGDTTLFGFRSRLEFPLDVTLVGGQIDFRPSAGAAHGWSLTLWLVKNLDNPDGKMYDEDWYTFPEYDFSREFSYTESRTKIDYKQLRLELARRLGHGEVASLQALAGYEYTTFSSDIIGAKGWQWSTQNVVAITDKGIVYEADINRPYVGAELEIEPNWQWLLNAKMVVSRVMISDRDDHVLRYKTAEASTSGWGFGMSGGGRLLLSETGEWRPFVSLSGEWLIHKATGDQTQRWYDDETYYNPDSRTYETVAEKGTVIEGIDYETKATQFRVGVGFGLAF